MANRAPSQVGAWVSVRLRALVPGWASAMFLGVPLAQRLRFEDGAERLRRRVGGLVAPTSFLTTDAAPRKDRRMRTVDAHVPAEMFLQRRITAPPGARGRLATVAELDLRQRTPFRPDEIFALLGPAEVEDGTVAATQWVAKRADVALWRTRLAAQGLRLRRVYVAGVRLPGPIADFTAEIAGAGRHVRRLNGLLAATAAAAAVVGALYPAWNAAQQTAALDGQLSELRDQAIALRREVETLRAQEVERAAFLDLLFRRPLLVETLRELTVALPDDVWLANLEFRPERAVIVGEAQGSAADTVLLLSQRPQFGNPRISGTVARTASNAERFEITVDLGRAR